MEFTIILLLTWFGAGVVSVTGQFSCNNLLPPCSCSTQSDGYEISCDSITVFFNFHENKVQLQCNSVDPLNYTVLSDLHFGDIDKFMLSWGCPLPDTSIRDLMKIIGINRIEMLQIHTQRNLNDSLQKKHFENLTDVSRLSLDNNGLTSLPVDLFEDMRNLTWLDLKFNSVNLPKDIFRFTPKLEVLELGNNSLTHLPPGIFKNLDHLRLLNLWKNNLLNLSRGVFSDVPNLELLDLNTNGLENIRPDIFADLVKLKSLNLYGNAFRSLPQGLLSRNIEIKEFQLHENRRPLVTLPSGFLSNLTELKVVRLSGCKLTSLPEDVFSGSGNIANLHLNRNSFKSFAEKILFDLENLEFLDLSENYITHLPENLFMKTKKLKTLKLHYNYLTDIEMNLFSHMGKLEHLDLRFNRLKEIKGKQFYGLTGLKSLNISDNQLVSIAPAMQLNDLGNYSVLQNCKKLVDLQLANNSLSEIHTDWRLLFSNLRVLNLAFNNFQRVEVEDLDLFGDVSIDLSNNKITLVNFRNALFVAQNHLNNFNNTFERDLHPIQKRIKFDNNPFACDCWLLPFVQFVQNGLSPEVQYLFDIPSGNLKCKEPMALEKQPLSRVPLSSITCRFPNDTEYKCPEHCICEYRPIDTGNIINCRGARLQQVPSYLPLYKFANHTELVLDDNLLTSFVIPKNKGYENVTHFHLSNNNLKSLNISGFSNKLKVLDISHNNLNVLTPEITTFLEHTPNLDVLLLNNNPWECDCNTIPLLRLLRKKFTAVKLLQNITCPDSSALEKLEDNQLCPESGSVIVIICIILAVFSLLVAFLTALYYQYRIQIHIYCFSSKWKALRWMVSHPDIDEDKKYDAFVSYAKEDEPFILEHLIPELEENKDTKFKLCVHFRDWRGGDSIPNQILHSVQNSRRTIVVLSPSFLESVWGIVEFRTAHSEALKTGTSKVIVVLKEDVGAITDLEEELKAYLQMNTYVKWGSPWFWQQLKFALPHPPEDPNDINCFFGCFPKINNDSRSHNILQNVCLKDGEVAYVTEMTDKINSKDTKNLTDKKSSPIIECVDIKLPEQIENGAVIHT